MAPEQGTDTHGVDIRADIYSLGATLYKLLTGVTPFSDPRYNSTIKKLMALATTTPRFVESLRPDCPPELAQLVSQMLAKSPDDRPTTPDELASLLEPFAKDADLGKLVASYGPLHEPEAHGPESMAGTLLTADVPTFVSSSPVVVDQPAPIIPPNPPRRRRGILAAAGAAAFMLLMGLIIVVTNRGSIEIDAPEDMVGQVQVKVRLESHEIDSSWKLKPGKNKVLTVWSGNVEVKLPDDNNEYELVKPDEMVVTRGKTVVFRLRHRVVVPSDETIAGTTPPVGNPILFTKPQPLEEWLKGREIVTVALDGSGQFKSIQSAIDALKSGQVIEVLDRGPYREVLSAFPPEGTGLISRHKTVIELHGSQRNVPKDDPHQGHIINPLGRFRLHGFHFVANLNEQSHDGMDHTILMGLTDHTVIENCWFQGSLRRVAGIAVCWQNISLRNAECFVRDCAFNTSLVVNVTAQTVQPRAVVVRNWFRTTTPDAFSFMIAGSEGACVVRDNAFTGCPRCAISLWETAGTGSIEISNNSILTGKVLIENNAKSAGLSFCNNFCDSSILFGAHPSMAELAKIYKSWQVSNNRYIEPPKRGNEFPVQKSDLIGDVNLLSKDPAEPNYLRLATDAPDARRGVGGSWPAYIGALLPGPVARDGDWFTRLRQRWPEGGSSPVSAPAKDIVSEKATEKPIEFKEPPSLDEWLKGRTILTVAQDGSGQFKTIQEALNALQSGQVVKVMDKGPYQERLEITAPPPDVGLVSEVQTRIECPKFADIGDKINYGHRFITVDRFRIHGFEFAMPEVNGAVETASVYFERPHGAILENCAVRRRSSGTSTVFGLVLGEPDVPNLIRDCCFETRLQLYCLGLDGSAVVLRNYLAGDLHALIISGKFKHGVVRHNIFAPTVHTAVPLEVIHADWFDFTNNTILSFPDAIEMDTKLSHWAYERSVLIGKGDEKPQPNVEQGHAPRGSGAIYNNLHHRARFLNVTGGGEREPWSWQIGYNCYPGDGSIAAENAMPRGTNTIATPMFYSIRLQDAEFARLKLDSPGATTGAGGHWPSYAGALPPGPAPQEGDWFSRLRDRWMK